jgi:hypothetical protein
MIVYVVFESCAVIGGSFERKIAEKLMAKQIERVCENTRDAERQNGRCYDVKATLSFVKLNEGQKVLTTFDPKELELALEGVSTVKVEVAGMTETYRIQSTKLVG